MEDAELLRLQERLLRLADEPTDRLGARQVFRDLRLMVLFALFVAAPEHLDGADLVVRRRFEEFCVAHDEQDGGRKVDGRDEGWFRDRLVMAGALRIAARIVFGDDPYAAASEVTPLGVGLARAPGAKRFAAVLRRSAFYVSESMASARLSAVLEAVAGRRG